LELANIPFAGSGSVASALAMNKLQAKRIVSYVNVPTPDYKYIPQIDQDQALKICRDFGFPLVVKPNNGGSTVGVTIVGSEAELSSAIEQVANLEDDLLIERYIAGREITVGILDDKGLSVVEIAPKDGFYDYKHKYTGGQSDYICPAEISAEATKKCLSYAEQAFNILGCRVFGRVDFRMREDGRIFFLEVNTIPGMTAHSLVPKSASAVGINFNQLVEQIVQLSKNIKR
jgi:D-alanine-D-alanine ligase